jgi:hypothetical protein
MVDKLRPPLLLLLLLATARRLEARVAHLRLESVHRPLPPTGRLLQIVLAYLAPVDAKEREIDLACSRSDLLVIKAYWFARLTIS